MNMRKFSKSLLGGLALTSLLYAAPGVWADDDRDQFKARLIGFGEVPAVSSTGTGRFQARIVDDSSIDFKLTYEGLGNGHDGGPCPSGQQVRLRGRQLFPLWRRGKARVHSDFGNVHGDGHRG